MMTETYMVRYYEEVDILRYPWVYHDRYEHYLPKKNPRDEMGYMRTGPMDCAGFTRLKDDIEENGIECPFIIEYYRKDLPNAKGLRDAPVLAIRTGNNRAEALCQLGITFAPALFVVPRTQLKNLPTDPHVDLVMDRTLASQVNKYWHEIVRGNNEPIGLIGAWRDSELLTDICRETENRG